MMTFNVPQCYQNIFGIKLSFYGIILIEQDGAKLQKYIYT